MFNFECWIASIRNSKLSIYSKASLTSIIQNPTSNIHNLSLSPLRFPLTLLACLIAAYALSAALTITVNPETAFWAEAVARREAAVSEIREKSPDQPITFFAGGSSCAFSIDPKVIEETTGQPAVNLGLPVSAGARYILHHALSQANTGDLLVVCLEQDLLTFPDQESSPSKTGFALEVVRGNLTDSAGGSTFGEIPGISDYLTLPRPGANYLITLAGRGLTGKGYRYKPEDVGYRGLLRTDSRDPSLRGGGDSDATSLHPEGRLLLETFAAAAKQKGVRLAYSMPWYFTDTASLAHNRANNQKVLADIATIIPVLEDGFSGAMDGIENFADSGLHLSDSGTAARSQALAEAMAAGNWR
jgi:hypothetical protein